MSARAQLLAACSEAEFQAAIIREAELQGWLVYHTHDSRRSQAGFPDLILVRGPELIALECKRETTSATPDQEKWIDALDKVERVFAHVVRPSLWDALVERLRKHRTVEAVRG